MPTYTVITSNLELDESKKKSIAEGITKIHSKTTGANTYFAQVIFNETKKNSHFMGGKRIVTLWGAKLLRMNKFILMAK